jgi:N4-gp56 family major capsid protein
MALTTSADLIQKEVFSAIALGEFTTKSKMLPFAKAYNNLRGNPGGTIHFPKWNTLTDADDLTEGTAITTETLGQADTSATIKEIGKGVEITDKALITGLGDAIGESARQIGIAIANKVDNDLFTELYTSTQEIDGSAGTLSYANVVDALALLGENMFDAQALFIHSAQMQSVLKDSNFISASQMGQPLIINGFKALGTIAGVPVVVSDRVSKTYVTDHYEYEALLFRPGAVGLAYARALNIEKDRDVLVRSTIVVGTLYYALKLVYPSYVVKIKTK